MGSFFTRPAGLMVVSCDPGCEINRLSDADLALVFKHLPPYARLIISEVCKRWRGISRKAWLDISHLDLSPIPGPNITAVIKQCPNLRHVTAVRKTFAPNELRILSRISLQSLKFYDCTVLLSRPRRGAIDDAFSAVFSDHLSHADWQELVLHDLEVNAEGPPGPRRLEIGFPATFPPSLKHLEATRLKWPHIGKDDRQSRTFLRGIEQLVNVETLILHGIYSDIIYQAMHFAARLNNVSTLTKLRELALYDPSDYHLPSLIMKLPELEVLFLHCPCFFHAVDEFTQLVTKHPSLRILTITVSFWDPMEFPKRVRYGNGFNAAPLPQLHIFVGWHASENILFPKFPSDAAKVYPISELLPQFLERADIKPIFEGVWIAEKIREAARQGSVLYDYPDDLTTSIRVV